jgi:hypothetical protein
MVAGRRAAAGQGSLAPFSFFQKPSAQPVQFRDPAAILSSMSSKILCVRLWLCPDQACIWLGGITNSFPVQNEASAFRNCGRAAAKAGGGWRDSAPLELRKSRNGAGFAYWHPNFHRGQGKDNVRLPGLTKGGGAIREPSAHLGAVVGSLKHHRTVGMPSSALSITRTGLSAPACCTMQRGARTDWLRADRSLHSCKSVETGAPVSKMHPAATLVQQVGRWGGLSKVPWEGLHSRSREPRKPASTSAPD